MKLKTKRIYNLAISQYQVEVDSIGDVLVQSRVLLCNDVLFASPMYVITDLKGCVNDAVAYIRSRTYTIKKELNEKNRPL